MTPELYVTNFNARHTGVSATARNVARAHAERYRLALVGHPLDGLPSPISTAEARRICRTPPEGRPFAIWHVRRDPEMIAALWARDVLRLPIRTVFTSAARHRHSAFPRWLIARQDAVIATTEAAAAFFPGVAATIPHGVDLGHHAPAADRAAAWAALPYGGRKGVATIGRVRPEKGTDIFVEAMITVCRRDPDVTALVVGLAQPSERAFEDGLKARVAEAGLADRILFPGFVTHEAQQALLPALSAVVNVARYEPFGIVPVEGMAAGTPFVCSDTGYYRDFAHGGETGVIVPPGDAGAAAAAVRELLSDPVRVDRMGAAGRRCAAAHHSIAREAEAVAEIYERLWAGEPLARHRR